MLDQLNLLPLLAQLLFGLLLLVVFDLLESLLSAIGVLLDLLLAIVVRTIVIGICLG